MVIFLLLLLDQMELAQPALLTVKLVLMQMQTNAKHVTAAITLLLLLIIWEKEFATPALLTVQPVLIQI